MHLKYIDELKPDREIPFLYKRSKIFIYLFLLFLIISGCSQKKRNPLKVSDINPRYFTDNSGKAVYLTGAHTWNNLVDMVPAKSRDTFDFKKYLDFLKSYNHNFIRLWAWDLLTWDTEGNREKNSRILNISPQPWKRTGPGIALDGKPRFNLKKFNSDYFNRLKERVETAGKAGIYVSVMLFEGWGLQFSSEAFNSHPFNPNNNVNRIEFSDKMSLDRLKIYELGNQKITKLQEAYVRKVIKTIGNYDNVLYEISNENHPQSTEWQYHMIRHIKNLEKRRGISHPVGMTFQFQGGNNQTLFESPADWISPNAEGGYRHDPPDGAGKKVILSDTDHLWGIGGNRQWVWKSFLRGLNPVFMDPYDGKVLERGSGEIWAEEIRVAMGHTQTFAKKLDLINFKPAKIIASSGYCLENPGKELLIYIPEGKKVEVNLTSIFGNFDVEWFDTVSGNYYEGVSIEGGREITLTTPFDMEESIVHLKLK